VEEEKSWELNPGSTEATGDFAKSKIASDVGKIGIGKSRWEDRWESLPYWISGEVGSSCRLWDDVRCGYNDS
jgi:hypothetical protein